ncbi:MAG: permease prefix domain 1-containing protein [Spirochaetes bacterium]|nr:permease prefix domain 1-containing protein [Spirochaetota bacterium]
MTAEVDSYLAEVRSHLHLDLSVEHRVIGELASHFEDKLRDLREEGMSEREAVREAIVSFGGARSIARLLYQAYSRGTWVEAFLACQPHLLAAALFAAHQWRSPALLGLFSAVLIGIAVAGWLRGRPAWVYSWAGYAFFPLLVLAWLGRGVLTRAVSAIAAGGPIPAPAWQPVVLLTLCAAGGVLLVRALRLAARRDWVVAALLMLPLPVFGAWLLAVERFGGLTGDGLPLAATLRWDPAMARLCLLLAAASALAIRARSRSAKAAAILAAGIGAGAMIVRVTSAEAGFAGLAVASLVSGALLAAPALLGGRAHKS